jgi:hypothetical protein
MWRMEEEFDKDIVTDFFKTLQRILLSIKILKNLETLKYKDN